jgi:hypothetical protein
MGAWDVRLGRALDALLWISVFRSPFARARKLRQTIRSAAPGGLSLPVALTWIAIVLENPMNHDYVVYCYSLPAGSPDGMFAMGIAVPQFNGSINMNFFQSQSDLQQTLTRLGLTPAQQNQIVADIATSASMSITSGVSIPNNVAGNFGIEFHDGEMPNEPNQIDCVRVSQPGAATLTVTIDVNDQIMPAPTRAVFPWSAVQACLLNSGVLSQAQIDAIQTTVVSTGAGSGNWKGVSTAVLTCLAAAACAQSAAPAAPGNLNAQVG